MVSRETAYERLFEIFHLQRRRSVVPGAVDHRGRDEKA